MIKVKNQLLNVFPGNFVLELELMLKVKYDFFQCVNSLDFRELDNGSINEVWIGVAVFEFLNEGLDMNGLVAKSVESVENGFKLMPSLSVENTFSVNNFLKGIWQIF